MLYYNFDGYEGFNCRFGIIEHDNGKKTRRNKILLDFIKDRNLLRKAIRTNNFSLLNISNMADLKKIMFEKIMDSGEDDGLQYEVNLINYTFRSGKYETDDESRKVHTPFNHGNIIRKGITGKRNHLFAGMLRSGLAGFFPFNPTEGKQALR